MAIFYEKGYDEGIETGLFAGKVIAKNENRDSLVQCGGEKASLERNCIKEENLATEASHWCYLVITPEGLGRPSNPEDKTIRVWNRSNDDVSYAGYKYWLSCDTKYR